MNVQNKPVRVSIENGIAIITVNSPPVNALSNVVRDGLYDAFKQAIGDTASSSILLRCEGATFMAGADLREVGAGKPLVPLRKIQDIMDASQKPIVAAIHGTALGGGFEIALCAHFRVADKKAKCGLPEVLVGLLPGAGGTQRLTRLVGAEAALGIAALGKHVPAQECLKLGMVDELAEPGKLDECSLAFAERFRTADVTRHRVRDRTDKIAADRGRSEIFAKFRAENERRFRGFDAPELAVKCVEAAVELSFEEGLAAERRYFEYVRDGVQSKSLRYAFFAERTARKIRIKESAKPIAVRSVGVLGAGTMGAGIATSFAAAGIPVTVVDSSAEALQRGLKAVRGNLERLHAKSGASTEDLERKLNSLSGSEDIGAVAAHDLVIEAVFEQMEIKKDVFKLLDKIAKPGAILASNTSYLDVNEIAAVTSRPESVLGLHFFSPAHIMKLLEVVKGAKTSDDVVLTSMEFAKRIGKIAVQVGVCHGFVGNRMHALRKREAQKLLVEGATPWQIDRALYDFGFAMGPFATSDLAGLDLGWMENDSKGETIRDLLCESGRRGQKTGAGYYDYDENREPSPSKVTEQIVEKFRKRQGVKSRSVSDVEIVERCIYSMINEGCKVLEEGIAKRASDIDVIWLHGYGWPRYKGGPMWFAENLGLAVIRDKLLSFQRDLGDDFAPSTLLLRLASKGGRFEELAEGGV